MFLSDLSQHFQLAGVKKNALKVTNVSRLPMKRLRA